MKLFGTTASNNLRRCWAVALHLGIPVEVVEVMPLTAAANTAEFRRLSPSGRVPALLDGELALTESHAIMLYFAGLKGDRLWPGDNLDRARVMSWMSWALAHWHPGWQPLQWENFIKPGIYGGQTDAAKVTEAEGLFHREAKLLDDHLRGREWLVGQELTLADFSVAAGLSFAVESRLPLELYPDIRAWYGRMERLPAWKASTPRRQ